MPKTPSDDVVTNYAEEHDLLKTARTWQWGRKLRCWNKFPYQSYHPLIISVSFRIGSACSAHWLLNALIQQNLEGGVGWICAANLRFSWTLGTCTGKLMQISRKHEWIWTNHIESEVTVRGHCQRSLSEVTVMSLEYSYRAPSTWSCSPDFSRKSCVALASSTDCLWPQICFVLGKCFRHVSHCDLSLASPQFPWLQTSGGVPILALKYLVFGRYLPHPYPSRGGGRGGQKPTCRIPLFFFAWKPWDSDPTPQILNKPWALVRKNTCA